MDNIEFIEPHAVTGTGGQQWPVEHWDRDQEIAYHVEQVRDEVRRDDE